MQYRCHNCHMSISRFSSGHQDIISSCYVKSHMYIYASMLRISSIQNKKQGTYKLPSGVFSDFKNNLHTVNGKHKIRPVDISSWISRKSINWLLLKNYWIFSDKIWYVFVGDIMNQIYKTSINLRDTINVTNVFWPFLVGDLGTS